MTKKKVVVIGGGFGGVYVTQKLRKLARKNVIDLTIINKTNYFLFTPLLHEVATGGLSPISVAEPIRYIFHPSKVNFVEAKVEGIDFESRKIRSDKGNFSYDILVIATGATTNFYGISGAEENSLAIKDLSDALKIRSQIIESFEKAAQEPDPEKRKKYLTFAVVGAGATGVELVAEMSEFIFDTLYPFFSKTFCKQNDVKIFLISSTSEILPMFSKTLRNWAEIILKKKKIEIIKESKVTEVTKDEISLSNNVKIGTNTVIWTAGVSPKLPDFLGEIEVEKGRLKAEKDLRIKNLENVFVLGDSAHFLQNEKPLPMLAQVTVQQAKLVSGNIKRYLENRPLQNFKYKSKGNLVSLGRWMAIGDISGIYIKGALVWWLWRTIYLFKFNSWRKRFRIASEWTLDLFSHRDTTKIG